MKIVIVNGGAGGATGNSALVIARLHRTLKSLRSSAQIEVATLKNQSTDAALASLQGADGMVFVTGTYWDSWGSPLQRFLEEATSAEGTDA